MGKIWEFFKSFFTEFVFISVYYICCEIIICCEIYYLQSKETIIWQCAFISNIFIILGFQDQRIVRSWEFNHSFLALTLGVWKLLSANKETDVSASCVDSLKTVQFVKHEVAMLPRWQFSHLCKTNFGYMCSFVCMDIVNLWSSETEFCGTVYQANNYTTLYLDVPPVVSGTTM